MQSLNLPGRLRALPAAGLLLMGLATNASPQTVDPVREVTIGGGAGTDLTFVAFVTPLSDSTLVVTQPLENHVKLFDWSGRLLRTVGREGSGPGEFRSVGYTGRLPDGAFWVSDGRLATINVFAADGALTATRSARGAAVARILAHPSEDTLIILRRAADIGAEIVPVSMTEGVRGERWLGYRLPGRPPLRYHIPAENRQASARNPFQDPPVVNGAVDGSGVVHVSRSVATSAEPDSFRILVLHRDGSRVERWITYRPVPVDEEDIDRAAASVAVRERLIPGTAQRTMPVPALEAAIRKAMWVPSWHPPVSDARLAADGCVWLRREDTGPRVLWEVYSPNAGHVDASFFLPSSSQARAVDGDRIWVMEETEYGEPLIVRYRIPGMAILPLRGGR